MTHSRQCLLVACLVGASPAPLAGQDGTIVRMVGEVRDIATERPIDGIAVKVIELGLVTVTDPNGFFMFDSIQSGTWTVEASGFGYATNVEAATIGPRSLLLIRLESQPIELEGLYVTVVQRLVRRRMAAPSRVFAWEKPELAEAIAPNVGLFVARQGVARFVTCGGEYSDTDLPNCYILKGKPVRLRVYLDDEPVLAAEGTSRLWAYDPRDLSTLR